jgi:transposase
MQCPPRLGRGGALIGRRLNVPTTSQHQKCLNVSGWVAPLLGRAGVIQTRRGNREGFLKVLQHLYSKLRGYTIWLYVDRARWHRGDPIWDFLKTHKRLRLVYLPPYQPALNMQERIWRQIRYESTTNRWFDNLDAVWATVQRTLDSWSKRKIRRLCNMTQCVCISILQTFSLRIFPKFLFSKYSVS